MTDRIPTILLAAASTIMAPFGTAIAAPAGNVVTPSAKGVFISREGKLIPVSAPTALRAGDGVVTRATGAARVNFNGCAINVRAMSAVVLPKNRCASVTSIKPLRPVATTAGVNAAQDEDGAAAAGIGGSAIGVTTVVIIGFATAAIIAGIAVAASTDAAPQSP